MLLEINLMEAAAVCSVSELMEAIGARLRLPAVHKGVCCVQGHSWLAAAPLISVQSFMRADYQRTESGQK